MHSQQIFKEYENQQSIQVPETPKRSAVEKHSISLSR
jgi:hypothetical protein